MKFLCLAYGNDEDWKKLNTTVQNGLLAQDEILRRRGDVVAEVDEDVTTVRAWDGAPSTTRGTAANSDLPLAGFYIVEAADQQEAMHLVAETPCARANGAIELRAIVEMNDQAAVAR